MHIPDGFLSPTVATATGAGTLAAVVYAGWRQGRAERKPGTDDISDQAAPLLGVTAAFIFAAQMLNFPVAAGTSGHFMGGVLAAVLLGPWRGLLAMGIVLLLQALMFADGGLLALGANVLNMGLVGSVGGWLLYRALSALLPRSLRGATLAAGIAAWASIVVAAALAAFELALSGTVALGLVLPAMVGVHALIGIGEAVITSAALGAVAASRPELLRLAPDPALGREGVRP